MSELVKARLNEICPDIKVSDDDYTALKDCHTAFEIIGYKPRNLVVSFCKIWESDYPIELYLFIYNVWEVDHGD